MLLLLYIFITWSAIFYWKNLPVTFQYHSKLCFSFCQYYKFFQIVVEDIFFRTYFYSFILSVFQCHFLCSPSVLSGKVLLWFCYTLLFYCSLLTHQGPKSFKLVFCSVYKEGFWCWGHIHNLIIHIYVLINKISIFIVRR